MTIWCRDAFFYFIRDIFKFVRSIVRNSGQGFPFFREAPLFATLHDEFYVRSKTPKLRRTARSMLMGECSCVVRLFPVACHTVLNTLVLRSRPDISACLLLFSPAFVRFELPRQEPRGEQPWLNKYQTLPNMKLNHNNNEINKADQNVREDTPAGKGRILKNAVNYCQEL